MSIPQPTPYSTQRVKAIIAIESARHRLGHFNVSMRCNSMFDQRPLKRSPKSTVAINGRLTKTLLLHTICCAVGEHHWI